MPKKFPTRAEIVALLVDWGYLDGPVVQDHTLTQAIRDFQSFVGILSDGWVGPVTTRAIERRFCAVPDILPLGFDDCKFEDSRILWTVRGQLNNIADAALKQVFRKAWRTWSNVCNITPTETETPPRVGCLSETGRIDRAGGTLAWSELPCGNDRLFKQLYDSAEPWSVATPPPQLRVSLYLVALHEIGHVLGIPHGPRGNLMAPIYNPNLTGLQEWDIEQAQKRYGPPEDDDPPDDPTHPTPDEVGVIVQAGPQKYAGSIPAVQ